MLEYWSTTPPTHVTVYGIVRGLAGTGGRDGEAAAGTSAATPLATPDDSAAFVEAFKAHQGR